MVFTITDILNNLNQMGIFSYLIPFLLVFAIVFAILEKTKVFGENKGVSGLIAICIGALSLLNDFVPTFFATIFPKFGIGLAIFLVVIVLIGFFVLPEDKEGFKKLQWIGILISVAVVVWSLFSWYTPSGNSLSNGFLQFFKDNWPLLVIIVLTIVGVIVVVKQSNSSS